MPGLPSTQRSVSSWHWGRPSILYLHGPSVWPMSHSPDARGPPNPGIPQRLLHHLTGRRHCHLRRLANIFFIFILRRDQARCTQTRQERMFWFGPATCALRLTKLTHLVSKEEKLSHLAHIPPNLLFREILSWYQIDKHLRHGVRMPDGLHYRRRGNGEAPCAWSMHHLGGRNGFPLDLVRPLSGGLLPWVAERNADDHLLLGVSWDEFQ